MSRLLVWIVALGALALGGLGGWVAGLCSATKSDENITQTMIEAERGYLSKRFESAYQRMPPTVAVWEGTNLLKYLDDNHALQRASPEEAASEILIYARLSELFTDLGDQKGATVAAKKAESLFNSINKNAVVAGPSEIVSNVLAKERVTREYTNDQR
jgi:hypothetical protein